MAHTVCHPDAVVDLHVHTSVSDGSDLPASVVDIAADAGLSIIAVTDHDTTTGLKEAETRGVQRGISVIRGIELSADYLGHSVHILGLGIGEPDHLFDAMIQKVLDGRKERNPKIIRSLNEIGYQITLNEAAAIADGDILSRPHIAAAMLQRGYVSSIEEAFKRFLNRGRPAYHERYRPSVMEATEAIHRLGGLALPAHPGLMRFDHRHDDLLYHFTRFKEMGIDGIETFYPTHSETFRQTLSGIARKLDLLESGGSDFHGRFKPNLPGIGIDGMPIRCSDIAPLLERLGFTVSAQNKKGSKP